MPGVLLDETPFIDLDDARANVDALGRRLQCGRICQ